MTRCGSRAWSALVVLALATTAGCETVHGDAAAFGPRVPGPSARAVRVHTVGAAPAGLAVIGVVRAEATGDDAEVQSLMAELVRQAQRLGATDLVVDDVRMRYRWVPAYTTWSYRCGWGAICWGSTPAPLESATLVAWGRALAPAPPPPAPPAPARSPAPPAGEAR
jgi:hypothetical protein